MYSYYIILKLARKTEIIFMKTEGRQTDRQTDKTRHTDRQTAALQMTFWPELIIELLNLSVQG